MVLALSAAVPGLGRPGTVFAFETPTVTITPSAGPAGTAIEVRYSWPTCGGIPAGDYVLELYWDSTANPLASAPFTHPGAGDCELTVQTAMPSGAGAGSHDVIAHVRDQKGEFIGFSDVKGGVTVTEAKATTDPKETPKPAKTPNVEPTSGPKEPPKPDAEPTVDPDKPTPDAGETSGPGGTGGEPLPTPGPQPVGPPPPSLPPGTEIVPVSELVDENDTVMDMVSRIATDAGHVASDLIVGGMTAAMMAIGRGVPIVGGNAGPRLSVGLGEAVDPDVAANATDVFVVWSESIDGNWEVMFARSTDHGYRFGRHINISRTVGASEHPRIVANGPNLTVAWDDTAAGIFKSIQVATSADSGATWSTPMTLGPGWRPVLATGGVGGTAYVAWTNESLGLGGSGSQVYFQRVGVGSPQHMSARMGSARNPAIAATGSTVSLAWEANPLGDWDVYYYNSGDGGSSWTSPTYEHESGLTHSRFSQYGDQLNPALAADGQTLVMAYESRDRGTRYVRVESSSDGGRSIGDARTGSWAFNLYLADGRTINGYSIEDSTYQDPMLPAVAVRGSTWALAYLAASRSVAGNKTSLIFQRGNAGTLTGSPAALAYVDQRDVASPLVGYAGSQSIVGWLQRDASSRPFDVILAPGSSRQNVSSTAGASVGARAAASGTNVTTVWTEDADGYRQVFYATIPAR